MVPFWILPPQTPASIHCFDKAEDGHFPAAIAPMYEPTGPSRSAACRPVVFQTRTALPALPSLLKSPVTLPSRYCCGTPAEY